MSGEKRLNFVVVQKSQQSNWDILCIRNWYDSLHYIKAKNKKKIRFYNKVVCKLPYVQIYPIITYTDSINGYDAYYIRYRGAEYGLYQFKKIEK